MAGKPGSKWRSGKRLSISAVVYQVVNFIMVMRAFWYDCIFCYGFNIIQEQLARHHAGRALCCDLFLERISRVYPHRASAAAAAVASVSVAAANAGL